ncbi:MAG: hypothetical protein Q9220_005035 [cf. Caloplaca sp. 1 TL-2023]
MNGHHRQFSSSSSVNEPQYGAGQHAQIEPTSQTLLNGYRDTLPSMVSYGGSSTAKRSRSRSSGPLGSRDPVSMHLLMETAMGESQHYEILSIEELDELKKELALLTSRIDATKRKLVLENKIRDAAQSFNRLDSPSSREGAREGFGRSPKGHRRSILGSRGSLSDLLTKTDDELAVSTKKCEELAQELWRMEKRMQELQRRLLEHTAGVLQVTHTGVLRNDTPPRSPDVFLPDTMARGNTTAGDTFIDFDDRSFYQTLESLLDPGDGAAGINASPGQFARQNQAIFNTERRLESLTTRLRQAINEAGTGNEAQKTRVGMESLDREAPDGVINPHLEELEDGLEVLQRDRIAAITDARQSAFDTHQRLGTANTRLRQIRDKTANDEQKHTDLPSNAQGQDLDQQLQYLETTLDTIDQNTQGLLQEREQLSSKSGLHQEKAGQYESTMMGLWDILASRSQRSGRDDSQRDSSGSAESGSSSTSNEEFSLHGFSGRVQKLHSQSTMLREQKDILTRQIQQQRDLNGKSDAQKDSQISDLTTELERTHIGLQDKQKEAKEARDELVLLTQHLDHVRQEATLQEQSREANMRKALEAEKQARQDAEGQLLADLETKHDEVHRLEAELADSKDDHGIAKAAMRAELGESENRMQQSISQLEAAREAKAHHDATELQLQQKLDESSREAEKAREELQSLEGEMVQLRTDLTVAEAALDGAYGTRAQRAAEMAPSPAVQKELDKLTEHNNTLLGEIATLKTQHDTAKAENLGMGERIQALQEELRETIGDYENMTKASIEFEKDREALEASLDHLRNRSEELENQLGEEKLKWLGAKSPVAAGSRDSSMPGSTSANVLKTEFKKMMREMRAENIKVLRLEQDERRKLEAVIRTLKKDNTPAKSPLNQSATAD